MKLRNLTPLLLVIVATAACDNGACILLGTPAVLRAARDASSGQAVSLVGASVTYTDAGGSHTQSSNAAQLAICCTRGQVQFRVQQRGYAPWDCTVNIPTQGRCNTPVPTDVVASLRRDGPS